MDSWEQTSEEQIKQKQKAEEIKQFLKSLGGCVYMLFFIGSIIGLCVHDNKQKKDHLNVVIENKDGKLLVEDVNTKEKRIVELWYGAIHDKDQALIFPGDTINVRQKEDVYAHGKIVNSKNAIVEFNRDSILVRKQRAMFNAEKQQMMKQR